MLSVGRQRAGFSVGAPCDFGAQGRGGDCLFAPCGTALRAFAPSARAPPATRRDERPALCTEQLANAAHSHNKV